MAPKNRPTFPQYLGVISTFGVTMGCNVYILSGLLGKWLDNKFGTSPLFVLIGLFVALVISFMFFFRELKRLDKLCDKDEEGK